MNGRHIRDARSTAGATGRVVWIDTARGLAIVLVVLIHAVDWIQETEIRIPLWNDVNEVLSTLRMPLFFVCSGILAVKWVTADWPDLLSRKITFLVWVYLIWQPVGSLAALVAASVTGDELTLVRMLGSLALTPVRPRFELWFLWSLALFFLFARLCARLPRAPQFAIAGALSALWFSSLVPETNLGWDGTMKYYVFFLIGCHYRTVLQNFAEQLSFRTSLLLIGAWSALSTTAYASGLDHVIGVGLVVRLVAVAAGIALALHLESATVFAYLGSRTLPIYLAHTPLIICFTWLLSTAHGGEWPPFMIDVLPVLFTLAAVALSLQAYSILRRPSVGALLYTPPAWTVAAVHRATSVLAPPILAPPVAAGSSPAPELP